MMGFRTKVFSVELLGQTSNNVIEVLKDSILLMLKYVHIENMIRSIDACFNFVFMTLSTIQMLSRDDYS